MHLPFTPNHVNLVSACYPPSAALLTSGPDYLPNSQELSKLTYYASNRPGKIHKLASELEKRVKADCKKAQAGNIRSRASLLITLYILKALAAECRRDIALLTGFLLSAVNTTLSALLSDLEVAARAATVFTAWTTYTDGHLVGVDREVTQNYMSCLQHFSDMGKQKVDDRETRNRTRLVGLAALIAAVHSEALYHASTHFKLQMSVIIPALFTPILEVGIDTLNHEASFVKEQPKFAFMDDFRTRPALERRAASIHVHIDGDKGPSSADVVNASLHAISSLLGHSTGMQASVIMSAALDYLDESGSWDKVEQCGWIAAKAAEWTQYQYRYAVPTRLVECLVEGQDASELSARHSTLAAMVTTVFMSPTPLVNVSTSDVISSLISLVFRRISVSPTDGLLPALVECIASLGTHVYYTDQIQDLAGEVISRIVVVESNGLPVTSKADSERCRSQALRCLLAGLLGLMHAADMHESTRDDGSGSPREVRVAGTSPNLPSASKPDARDVHIRPSRRTRIPPEVWHDTLILLCDRDYAVRADYAVALISYLRFEAPKLGDHTDADGSKRHRSLADGPTEQAHITTAIVHGDATTRLLNALHAYAYVLATASNIDLHSYASSGQERPTTSSGTTRDGSANVDSDQSQDQMSRRSMAPRVRKTSCIMRAMASVPKKLSHSDPPAATLSDYGNMLAVLTAVQEHLPIRGLFTGVPMLLALDSATREGSPSAAIAPFSQVVRQLVARLWMAVGTIWKCPDVVQRAEQAVSSTSSSVTLPPVPEVHPGTLSPPQQPVPLPGQGPTDNLSDFDSEAMWRSIASSPVVAETTGLDYEGLARRLAASWSAESAFADSLAVETNNAYDTLGRDALSPLIRVAPALMHIENISLQSLARSTRGVGVNDLRDALEGRSSISNPNLSNRAPSISTLDHTSSVAHPENHLKLTPTKSRGQQRSRLAGPGEVRDVLNRLGIGKQNGTSQLKSSFSGFQKPEQR
ncbi:hypothetical protein DAEQUDRAFT_781708 [Daedalea quercina L-15889]|uniref:Protein EFR3 n=1 Tax=Daedalea quercina L-15889 TaxID=1314783 RepID=A0A165U1W9_9APHY|nr:hypothetical protein DAEQUDRAFT_781708 [Daedalea quercina L-15889]